MKPSFNADLYSNRLEALGIKPAILDLIRSLTARHPPAFAPSSRSMPRNYHSPKMGDFRFASGSTLERGVGINLIEDSLAEAVFTQVPLRDSALGESGKEHVVDFLLLLRVPEKPPVDWCPLKFIDVKNEQWLRRNTGKSDCAYLPKTETPGWVFPPGEAAALNTYGDGASYQVMTQRDLSPELANNSAYLADYFRADCQPAPIGIVAKAREYVALNPGCFLEDILREVSGVTQDHCHRMIVRGELWVDLRRYEVSAAHTCRVFTDAAVAQAHEIVEQAGAKADPSLRRAKFTKGEHLIIRGRDQLVEYVDGTMVMLVDGNGEVMPMELNILRRLETDGKLRSCGVPAAGPQAVNNVLKATPPSELAKALVKFSRLEDYITKGMRRAPKGAPKLTSTERRWLRKTRLSAARYGRQGALLGCLRTRTPVELHRSRLTKPVLEALNKGIEDHYLNKGETCVAHAYAAYREVCIKENIRTVDLRTFGRAIRRQAKSIVENAKRGTYAAAQHAAPVTNLYAFGRAERHMQRGHVDCSVADLSLLCKLLGINLGTAWMVVMLDAYSKSVLASYVSYESPSAASTLCLFRDCVRRHGRMPSEILADNGPEFANASVEFFLAFYQIEFIRRPVGRPRSGAEIERFWGSFNKRVTDTMAGATAALRTHQRISPSHHPDRLAAYTINELQAELETYCYKVYDELPHAGLNGMSPREVREESLQQHGTRDHIHIEEDLTFRMLTLPLVDSGDGTAKIQANDGVQVSAILYWNDVFDSAELTGTRVPVRWDPLDVTRVYVFVRGEWYECTAPKLMRLREKTPEQLAVASMELRRARLSYGRNYTKILDQLQAGLFSKRKSPEEIATIQRLKASAKQMRRNRGENFEDDSDASAVSSSDPRPPMAPTTAATTGAYFPTEQI
jgi:putative transposase